jgi:hypothetical protein
MYGERVKVFYGQRAAPVAAGVEISRRLPRRSAEVAENPLHDGDRIPDPRAVLHLDTPAASAPQARQVARQGHRAHEAGVAAGAGDLEQHEVLPVSIAGEQNAITECWSMAIVPER